MAAFQKEVAHKTPINQTIIVFPLHVTFNLWNKNEHTIKSNFLYWGDIITCNFLVISITENILNVCINNLKKKNRNGVDFSDLISQEIINQQFNGHTWNANCTRQHTFRTFFTVFYANLFGSLLNVFLFYFVTNLWICSNVHNGTIMFNLRQIL